MAGSSLYDIDQIYNGEVPNALVVLSHPKVGTFKAPVIEDLSITGSAVVSSPFAEYASKVQNQSQQIAAGVNAAAGMLNLDGFDASQFAFYKVLGQTVSMWNQTERPPISLNMVFVTTKRAQNRYQQAVMLASCVYPQMEGLSARNGEAAVQRPIVNGTRQSYYRTKLGKMTGELKPPCEYHIGVNGMPENTWTIEIGGYFRAEGFVLESTAMTQTKQRLGDSEALIATVSCSLRPALDILDVEFREWFNVV